MNNNVILNNLNEFINESFDCLKDINDVYQVVSISNHCLGAICFLYNYDFISEKQYKHYIKRIKNWSYIKSVN